MSGTDPARTASDASATPPDAAGLESEMDGELAGLKAQAPRHGTHVLGPVFQHEQAAGSAVAAGEATETAARVAGSLAAEADQERLLIERQVAAVERPAAGSAQAADVEAAAAQAERNADGAVVESLDSDGAAEGARRATGSRFAHHGAVPAAAEADQSRALADEAAARDLAELDALEARTAADAAAVPPPTS